MDKATLAISSGVTVIGATGLNDTLSQVLGDLFTSWHLTNWHPSAWAALIIIVAGSWMHTHPKKDKPAIPPVQ